MNTEKSSVSHRKSDFPNSQKKIIIQILPSSSQGPLSSHQNVKVLRVVSQSSLNSSPSGQALVSLQSESPIHTSSNTKVQQNGLLSHFDNVRISSGSSTVSTVHIPKPAKREAVTVISDDGCREFVPPHPKKPSLCKENCNFEESKQNSVMRYGEVMRAVPEVPNAFKYSKLARRKLSLKKGEAKKSVEQDFTEEKPLLPSDTAEEAEQNNIPHLDPQLYPKLLEALLQEMLPSHYEYKIVAVDPMQPYHKENWDQGKMFSAEVRVKLYSKEDSLAWLDDFQTSSYSDWRVRDTYKENTKCLIFKKSYRCVHNTQAQHRHIKKGPHKKHTECKASLKITVKNFNMKRSTDTFLKRYPCEIKLDHCHNHPILAGDVLKYRRPGNAAVKVFSELFRRGHSPSSALHTHQYDIQVKNPDNFFEVLADGAECPNVQWCYYMYRKMFEKEYGAPSGVAMIEALKMAICKYNEDCGSECAKIEIVDQDIVVVLCTPFMKRVHAHLKASGEMGFVDSGGSMDRHNTRIFTFLAPSVAGALPTGVLMTSSEAEVVVQHGLRMLQSILPPHAYYGRGAEKGPEIMMTDDSASERNSLRDTFPGIILLLCYFHVLNAFWRYVWDSKHKVKSEDKEELFMLFKDWSKAPTEESFKLKYQQILAHPKIASNSFLFKHIKGLCDRAPEWALWYRDNLLTRGNDTNNYSEITVRLFKEYVLHRIKAYSVVQLFDFFTTRLDAYFERRIAAVLNNRQEQYWKSKHYIQPSKLEPLSCVRSSSPHIYYVKNSAAQTEYTVDLELEFCTCPVGKTGAPCKHQYAVVNHFNLSSSQFLPFSDERAKSVLHQIMTTTQAKSGWYSSLKGGPSSASGSENVNNVDVTTSEENPTCLAATAEAGQDTVSEPVDPEKVASALESWQKIKNFIKNGLKQRPQVFLPAVEKFSDNFWKAESLSENAVLSAMHLFAKSAGFKSVRNGRYIKVNSAAIIKRKYAKLGGSRKMARQGRPPKSARTAEHGYNTDNSRAPAWDRCELRGGALPHNITERVSQVSRKRKNK